MRPSLELNKVHLKTPMVGDYWTKHFVLQSVVVLQFVVLHILANGNIVIAGKDQSVKDGQTVDLSNAYEITPEQLKKLVMYDTLDGFVCDVTPVTSTSQYWVDAWKKEHCKRYKPYTEEIKTNETVISESPDKETEINVKRSADGTLSPTDKQIVNVILRTGTPEDKFKLLVSLGVIEGNPEPTEENIQYANRLIDAFLEIVL